MDLQLTIVNRSEPVFTAQYPAGPIWTVQYTAPAGSPSADSGTTSSTDSIITVVNNIQSAKSAGISKGAIAAAVLVPLLVLGLALGVYIKLSRAREGAKRKRWSEAVDKRMSTLSLDWRRMSQPGADAAIRASFVDGNRNSFRTSFAGNSIPRPSSTFAVEGAESDDGSHPPMTQIRRPGVGPRGPIPSTAGSDRVSRVSFAADTRFSRTSTIDTRARPSVESRRAGVPSRSFHSAYIPPVPALRTDTDRNGDSDSEENGSGAMSPTQREGPLALSAADIRARVQGLQNDDEEPRPSLDEVLPALSMMRTRNGSHADLILEPATLVHEKPAPVKLQLEGLTPPPAAATPSTPKSPVMDAMPMQPMPAGVFSPDDMLKVYAERRRAASGAVSGSSGSSPAISFPLPAASAHIASGNMRTLYSPNGTGVTVGSNNPFAMHDEPQPRRSTETQYDDEDAYYGVA